MRANVRFNLLDADGNQVNKGDRIAYPVRKGPVMKMKFGVIVDLIVHQSGQGGTLSSYAMIRDETTNQLKRFRSFGRALVVTQRFAPDPSNA